MKTFHLATVLIVSLLLGSSAFASMKGKSAFEQACYFQQQYMENGHPGAEKAFREMLHWATDQDKQKFVGLIAALQNLQPVDSEIFFAGALGNLYQEYLVVFELEKNTALIFDLMFSRINGTTLFTSFILDDEFDDYMKRPKRLVQTPEQVKC